MTFQKAFLTPENGSDIPCLFNPSEISVQCSNDWSPDQAWGRNAPSLSYTGGNSGSMDLSLTFDTTADGSAVTDHTNKLLNLMKIDPSLPGHDDETNNGRPPYVTFHWGDLHSFKAVVERLGITFTYFSSEGVPLRARAEVSLTQYEEEDVFGPQNPTSGTPDPHRLHQVQAGETLDRIAAVHYGDSTRWRLLATANGIVDPLALVPGTLLSVPRPKAAGSG